MNYHTYIVTYGVVNIVCCVRNKKAAERHARKTWALTDEGVKLLYYTRVQPGTSTRV